jgi:hypothetical protein
LPAAGFGIAKAHQNRRASGWIQEGSGSFTLAYFVLQQAQKKCRCPLLTLVTTNRITKQEKAGNVMKPQSGKVEMSRTTALAAL